MPPRNLRTILTILLVSAAAQAHARAPGEPERLALSDIQTQAQTTQQPAPEDTNPAAQVPTPEPVQPAPGDQAQPPQAEPSQAEPEQAEPGENLHDPARPQVKENGPPPVVEYDYSKLPAPVRETRERILAAAKSGDIEALRPLLGTGDDITALSLSGYEGDPIEYLKSLSGDSDGREVLAILVDLLDTGYVHLDAGGQNELYVWPYFFAYPIDKLAPPQMVELYQILTAGDFEEMKSFGAYVFYRIGISPDGKWQFFVAGD
ncbi:hypothetical protein GCM10011491_21350 [Brucella endophytica]|uniref:Ankyrin repeat domain-containing protein n=1 Tax=Brucella endophytica TaxID=1963359 RepID=A0A916SBZ1_9HYPH|nr:hypothetical protein [Brucella endophytica]GGA92992.1 hypothetical protein GCM10011491_21350 [Brucella endophytica]